MCFDRLSTNDLTLKDKIYIELIDLPYSKFAFIFLYLLSFTLSSELDEESKGLWVNILDVLRQAQHERNNTSFPTQHNLYQLLDFAN